MSVKVSDLLSPTQISSIRAPIEAARTFPNSAYTSQEFYALEIEKIYKRYWVGACFEFDAPEKGDMYPFEFCDMPMVLVHGDDGQLRVFHNVCPYDGCPVVMGPTVGAKKIIAPYHGWTFDLKGKLIATPYWDGTVEGGASRIKDRPVDLVEVPCETYLHIVFINLSDNPGSFDEQMAPIARQFDEHDLVNLEVATCEAGNPLVCHHERSGNWKTFYENSALNILHESFVHDLYSTSPEVPRIKQDGVASFKNIVDEGLLALGFELSEFPQTYPDFGFPHIGKGSTPPEKECFGTLYPNFYLSVSSEYVEITFLLPNGPEKVTERQTFLYHPSAAKDPQYAKMRRYVSGVYAGASAEDGAMVEAVQKARYSPVYDQKFYSPFWDELHYRLNKMILDDLESD